jgi:phage shock protein A
MKLWKRCWLKAKTGLRVIFYDLFSEEDPQGTGDLGTTQFGLEELRSRLDGLMPALAALSSRLNQLESDRQRAKCQREVLEEQIDTAIQTGNDSQARVLLGQRNEIETYEKALSRQIEELDLIVQEEKAEVQALRLSLSKAFKQTDEMRSRENSAAALEELVRSRREINREIQHLEEERAQREMQADHRTDRWMVVKDLDRRKR